MPDAVRVRYFAWLRERVGVAEESVSPPPEVGSVAALQEWLCAQDERHRAAFAAGAVIRCAVNQVFATPKTRVGPGDDVAFFPPVTGG